VSDSARVRDGIEDTLRLFAHHNHLAHGDGHGKFGECSFGACAAYLDAVTDLAALRERVAGLHDLLGREEKCVLPSERAIVMPVIKRLRAALGDRNLNIYRQENA